MVYLSPADFRTASLAEYCYGLDLTVSEASDAVLTTTITSQALRIDSLTDDHYESESLTLNLDVNSTSDRLYLPKRVRSLSQVNTRTFDGVLTTEATTTYRMHSSLTAGGDARTVKGGMDYIETIYGAAFLSTGTCYWPVGTQTVQVIGTFSWSAPPSDIKRAVARLVYDRLKERRPDLDRAESLVNAGVTVRFLETDPDHPTGIREVDEIVQDYLRDTFIGVG